MHRIARRSLPIGLTAAVALPLLLPAAGQSAGAAADAKVLRGLERLVAAPGGPPGAIATLHRGGRTTVLRAGRSDVRRRGRPRATDHMRIASISKAFGGAIALQLVQQGRLGLDDTIGARLPGMPVAWAGATIRQLLDHTSGVPDYTRSKGFIDQLTTRPRGFVSTATIIDWVRGDDLVFPSGSRYEYSNTENIIVGLIAEQVTGGGYRDLLSAMAA